MRSKEATFSHILSRLHHASALLDQFGRAIREGNPAAAEAALKDYTREFTTFRTEFAPISIARREYGMVGAVLDELESQLSRLEQMKGNVLAGHCASVEQPLNQVKLALRMVKEKVKERSR